VGAASWAKAEMQQVRAAAATMIRVVFVLIGIDGLRVTEN
jgi:hypothetical protein